MDGKPIPEIRLRKSSDAPSLSSLTDQNSAPLASFEALSDLEESDDNVAAGTGATSPDSDVFPAPPPPEDAAAAGPDYAGYAPMEEEMDIEEEHMNIKEELGSQELCFTDLGEQLRYQPPKDDTTPPSEPVHTASAWMDFQEDHKNRFDLLDEPPPCFDLDISAPATPDSDKTPTAEMADDPSPWLEASAPPPRPVSPPAERRSSSPSRPERPPSRPDRPPSPMKSPSRPDRPPSPMKSPSRPDRPPSPMRSPSRPDRPPSPYMAKSPSGNLGLPYSSGYQGADDGHKKAPSRPPPPKQSGESASEDELEQYHRGQTPLSPAKFEEYRGIEEPGAGGQEAEEYQGKTAPPKRPAPPPPAALKNLKKNVAPGGPHDASGGHSSGAGHDDESWMYDEEDDKLTTKKKKSKLGISPKKIIGGIHGIIDPSKKKDKKKKQAGPHPVTVTNRDRNADLEHFLGGKEEPKSDDWNAFQAMNARIQATVSKAKDNVKEIEGNVEETVQQLNTAAQNSPWAVQVMGPGSKPGAAPPVSSPPEVVGTVKKSDSANWVGFEDSFDSVKHMEVTKNLPHLNVTPIPSPKHTPVPPYNSRRNSQDDEKDEVAETAPPEQNGKYTEDLLGLNADIAALSRNIDMDEDNQSSGAASPVPMDNDIMALGGGRQSSQEEGQTSSVQPDSTVMDDFVDEFLGIKDQPPPMPKPVPIPTLEAKKEEPCMIEDDDDDPFGLGGLGSKKQETSTVVKGDLMGGIEDEDIGDPFAISDTTKAIAEGTANIDEILQQAQKLKTSAVSPMDDFDPRADVGVAVAPVADGAELWGSAVKAADNPFKAGVFQTEEVTETFCHAESTNPFASALASMNPFEGGADVADEVDLGLFGASEGAETADTFNPFATIHGDGDGESLQAEQDAGFDPFQTIQDDDAFIDFPKKDESAAEHPQRPAGPPVPAPPAPKPRPRPVGPPPIKITTTSIKPVSRPKAASSATGGESETITSFLPPPPKKADVQVQEEESEEEEEEEEAKKEKAEGAEAKSTNPFAAAEEEEELDPFAVFQKPAEEVLAENEAAVKAAEEGEEGAVSSDVAEAFAEPPPPFEVEEAAPEPLEPFHPPWEGDGWKLLLRQPVKKKLAGQRFWRPVYVRIVDNRGTPTVRVFENEESKTPIHELGLQACYRIHNMGLQTFDQFGKCHTVKIEYVFYRERVGMKADRITPTIGDLVRVRNLKGFKDLVHRPKTTMILEHAKQASELLKFGCLDYPDFKSFVRQLEDAMFHLKAGRETKTMTYTKDEVTVDIQDEYYADIDKDGHIIFHKARVRVFCIAFLTGMPKIEIGMNDKRRKGQEIVGRHDIIPIKTDEWIKLDEEPEFHYTVEMENFDQHKTVKLRPLDACRFEVMRFRARPKINKELPLQVRVQMSITGKHIEIRADAMVAGYYSNSRRASQTPCQDIAIRFPIPLEWIYMFRVEKRFRYGSVKSHTRKPGKIKGLERLTNMAQGFLPPSLIEVSAGVAKYENIFQAIVWRIGRLPERNEGAYKSHLFKCAIDLGPHDVMPENFQKHVFVEYHMPNSMVSRAQVRSVSIDNQGCEDPPDRWTHHLAYYEYKVDIEFVDTMREAAPEHTQITPDTPDSDGPLQDEFDLLTSPGNEPEKDSDTSSDEE